MADSNITKRALATALKELMEELPFEKINVAHICERCDMNRKSFYYHFKDKYDLVNWIFDTDIISFMQSYFSSTELSEHMEVILEICRYFYENRSFYSKALKIEGQNSFSEHFRECILPLLRFRLTQLNNDFADDDFALDFFADATVCTMERWLLDKNCMPPEQFVARLLSIVQRGAEALSRELKSDQ